MKVYTILTGIITHNPTVIEKIENVFITTSIPDTNFLMSLAKLGSENGEVGSCSVLEMLDIITYSQEGLEKLEAMSPETLYKIILHNAIHVNRIRLENKVLKNGNI